ncbi:small RNA 2'-O-methyltransferase-like [Gigantopelta aegis]|uniref:small RNA 2'-O-methyltransferase-like n=1 Tax=Gigantopelta aegis TaxID=1735272 RepID=UPI001B88D7E9|nr:small RNA 2'-O-methyltransferase-like [Gigantopelta aegis]
MMDSDIVTCTSMQGQGDTCIIGGDHHINEHGQRDTCIIGGDHHINEHGQGVTCIIDGDHHINEHGQRDTFLIGGDHHINEHGQGDTCIVGGDHHINEHGQRDTCITDGDHDIDEHGQRDTFLIGGDHHINEHGDRDTCIIGGYNHINEHGQRDTFIIGGDHHINEHGQGVTCIIDGDHDINECGQGDVRYKNLDISLQGAKKDVDLDTCDIEQGQGDVRDKTQTVGCENESSLGGPMFDPPLYVQRYGFVREVLEKHLVKSVVDFGSAQCKIITLLKTVPSLENIALVDKNGNLLNANKWNTTPLIGDYLHPRTNPLTVHLFEGCATMLDERIVGYEAATMIELIEHLHEDELSGVTRCLFGSLEPRLVIVTTPNCDFNQLFSESQGMRHWDHKFEWSQQEFKIWCQSVCEKFDYQVEITGVGEGPPGSENLGFCSQAAIFTQHSWSSSVDPKGSLCYRLIQSKEFPFKKDNHSLEDGLAVEVAYHLHKIALYTEPDLYNSNTVCVPLTKLVKCKSIQDLCGLEKLRDFMSRHYTLTSDRDGVVCVLEDESTFGSDIESDLDSDKSLEKQETSEVMSNEELWD